MPYVIIIIAALIAVAATWAVTHFVMQARLREKEAELKASEAMRANDAAAAETRLKELRDAQTAIIAATKNELALQNEKLMKEREESVMKQAREAMASITGGLDKDIQEMKTAFENQKKSHAEETSSIKTKFEETVKNLKDQTDAIGSQAVDLANALKGKNKMQGVFGETILENILQNEGLVKGRDYDAEYYLRDSRGNIICNEETGSRMRPDFILHYPDKTDVIIDSKVSLTALSDYYSASTDAARADASRRNLASVVSHIDELAGKEYQKYVEGRKSVPYVIMFIPNYDAFQLAKQEDNDLFYKAFSKNVLITTEESLVPFLALIRNAWIQAEATANMNKILDWAGKVSDRVALFCKHQADIEKSMEGVLEDLKENGKRLTEGKQSIAKAAQGLLECGAKLSPGKALPEK